MGDKLEICYIEKYWVNRQDPLPSGISLKIRDESGSGGGCLLDETLQIV